ncbi:MAG: hypothetical protein MUO72_05960 [Bacteroidales bacterium]|nr:hypothetical protein [Bacteroidales bacterium]
MKKSVFLIISLFLIIGVGCKKEDSMTLSEFCIGIWQYGGLDENYIPVTFIIEFNTSGRYILSHTDGSNTTTYPEKAYTIDEKDSEIIFNETDTTYDVLWESRGNTMKWTEDGNPYNPTIIIWARK